MFEAETLLVRGEGLTGHEIDGEILLLEPESEMFFGLDEVAASIWQRLNTPRTMHELCLSLTEEYDVDYQSCWADVTPFLRRLVEAGLLKIETREKFH